MESARFPRRLRPIFSALVLFLGGTVVLGTGIVARARSATEGAATEEAERRDLPPLERAHAHNDYHHARPLLDALGHGFSSVEADVFLVDGKLLIGHDLSELRPDRTLRSLYLDPLRSLAEKNKGSVHPKGGELLLLIDVKTEAKATWDALSRQLEAYRDILSEFRDGKITRRAVTAVVSGNRDFDAIARTSPRYAGVDGRLSDLDRDHPPSLMPLVSDHFGRNFAWRGKGPIPAAEREKLERIISRAHAKGYRVRFWATPEKRSVWEELLRANVDLINTDDLAGLERFLREKGDVGSGDRGKAELEKKARDAGTKPPTRAATPRESGPESPTASDE